MNSQVFSKIGIIVVFGVLIVGGFFAWQYWPVLKEEMPEVKAPEEIIEGETANWKTYRNEEITKDETANWKTYRNEEYGFEVKYPPGWKVESTFPGRLGPGQTEPLPGVNPQLFSFVPKEIDLTKEGAGISIYVAPPGFFTCPSVIPTDCISGQGGEIMVDKTKAMFLEGETTKYCPPEGRKVKEIYLCRFNNYFRFFTTKQQESIFNQMLSTFRFLE